MKEYLIKFVKDAVWMTLAGGIPFVLVFLIAGLSYTYAYDYAGRITLISIVVILMVDFYIIRRCWK